MKKIEGGFFHSERWREKIRASSEEAIKPAFEIKCVPFSRARALMAAFVKRKYPAAAAPDRREKDGFI